MTKNDLIANYAEKMRISKKDSEELIDGFLDLLTEKMASGVEEIPLVGFGRFRVMERPERMARNPKTGEQVPVKAQRSVTFRPFPSLKAAVNPVAK